MAKSQSLEPTGTETDESESLEIIGGGVSRVRGGSLSTNANGSLNDSSDSKENESLKDSDSKLSKLSKSSKSSKNSKNSKKASKAPEPINVPVKDDDESSDYFSVSGSNLSTVYIESDGNLCTQSSLREYKTNITSISDTSWLYNLNPVTFNWKKKTEVDGENVWEDTADDSGTQYGLIAEEVETVKKDFCYYNNDNKLSGVHYDRLIAPLIKAVQDLKKENDDLKTLIKNSSSFAALKSSL